MAVVYRAVRISMLTLFVVPALTLAISEAPNTGMAQSAKGAANQSSGASSGKGAADTSLQLTSKQKWLIYERLRTEGGPQGAERGFVPTIGSRLPEEIPMQEIPERVSSQVPQIANHRYSILAGEQILIIAPDSRRIVSVIDKREP